MLIPTVISLMVAFSHQGETNEGSNFWSQTIIQNKNVAQSQSVQKQTIKNEPKQTVVTKENKPKIKKIGYTDQWKTYEITAYTWTGNRTSSGVYPKEGVTVASNFIPQGTIIEIEGIGQRVVQDKGSRKYLRENVIDLYIGSSDKEARDWGRQERKVRIVKKGD